MIRISLVESASAEKSQAASATPPGIYHWKWRLRAEDPKRRCDPSDDPAKRGGPTSAGGGPTRPPDRIKPGVPIKTRVKVFLNQNSGTASGIEAKLASGFSAFSLGCDPIRIEPHMDVPRLAREAANQPDTIVAAAGGDGTVNAVAAGVAGTGCSMGVLPAGTLNHFAGDLGIPGELDRAIEIISQPNRSTVDTGEVNGHLFVNNSSVGLYTEVVTQRERLQKSGLGKWLALVLASARAFLRFHHLAVQLTIDGKQITRRTPILFVGNNEYRMEGARIGRRDRLNCGALFVYLAPGLTRLGMLRIAIAALFGRVREVPNFEQFSVTELTVDLHRPVCRVSLDGEVRHIPGPLRYRIRPASLKVCTPGPL